MSRIQGLKGLAILILWVLSVSFALPLAAGQSEVRKINREGNTLFNDGEWDKALERYTAAADLDPENPILHYNLANAFYRLNDLGKAESHYRVAAAAEDAKLARQARFNLGNTGFRQAEALEGAGDWQGRNKALAQSIGQWQSVLQDDPGNLDAKHNLELARKKLLEKPPESERQQQQQEDQQDQQGQQDKQDQQQEKQTQQDQQKQQAEDEGKDRQEQQQEGKDGEEKQQGESEQQQAKAEKDASQDQQPAGEEQLEEMRVSPEEAQRILDALRDEEMAEQRRQMVERKGKGGSAERDW